MMTMKQQITVRAGNSGTVGPSGGSDLGLVLNARVGDDGMDLTGQEIVFRVWARGEEVLRKDTSDGVTLSEGTDAAGDPSGVQNKITVEITVADSRTLQASGPALRYEVERQPSATEQRTIIYGPLIVEPGVNDD